MIKIKNIKNRNQFTKNFIRDSYWGVDETIKILERNKYIKKYFRIDQKDIKVATSKNSLFLINYQKWGGKCLCDICGLEGKYFALEKFTQSPNDKTINNLSRNTYHFNLYTVDVKTKEEVYFNIDHIQPKSKGGTNELKNMQLTCQICNTKKGNTFEEKIKSKIGFWLRIKKIFFD